jgi:hypothetical protein
MKILKAIESIRDKAAILKNGADQALLNEDTLKDFVSMMLEQYNETEGNKKRMNAIFTPEVMKCLVEYARSVNAFADVQLMEIQCKEANN